MVDIAKGFGKGDNFILERLKELNKPIFLLMNKVDLIKKDNPNVRYLPSFETIVNYLKDNLQDNDLVITIGAGPINKVANMLKEEN